MKYRILCIFFIIFIMTVAGFSQDQMVMSQDQQSMQYQTESYNPFPRKPYIDIRLGGMFPWGTKPGVRGGILAGIPIDQMVSANIFIDYYSTTYTSTVSNTSQTGLSSSVVDSETMANLIVSMANVRVDIPYFPLNMIQPYAQVGFGYELLFNNYSATELTEKSTKTFGSFGFDVEAGARMKLGDYSHLYLSGHYNFANLSKFGDTDNVGVNERIDLGGFGIKSGIGFTLF